MEILVIGNGLAGLSAALQGAEKGASVILASQNHADRSQSVMAEGGINAALNTKGEEDSTAQHCSDTLRAACGLASIKAVADMTAAAPDIIKYLSEIGTVFARDEFGNEDIRRFGGQKKQRTVFAKAGIGKQLVCALSQEVRKYEKQGRIKLYEHLRFEELIIKEDKQDEKEKACIGAVFQDIFTKNFSALTADAVVLAVGGLNDLFGETTGSVLSDGAAAGAAFRQGVRLANCEMIQYHPTTALRNGKRILISEAARGEGGRLFVYQDSEKRNKWYFMEEIYPEGGNLMPRDIISRTMYDVSSRFGQVYLDLTHLSSEALKILLKEVYDVCRLYLGIDPACEYIPVSAGVHYFMGGFYVDDNHRCSIKSLYAAGECACLYHGANRLGGNSTLGAIYGGKKAVKSAISDFELSGKDDNAFENLYIKQKHEHSLFSENYLTEFRKNTSEVRNIFSDFENNSESSLELKKEKQTVGEIKRELQAVMKTSMGIVRNEKELLKGLEVLKTLKARAYLLKKSDSENERQADREIVRLENLLLLAEAFLKSALARKESRGANIRTDFPKRDDVHFRKITVADCSQTGEIRISFAEVNGGEN